MNRDEIMRQWDYWRKAIADGDTSSAPRDWFESLIDASSTKAEMTRDDVLSAAVEAARRNRFSLSDGIIMSSGALLDFADIIEKRARESERDACVIAVIDAAMRCMEGDDVMTAAVDAIRARGETGTIRDYLTVGETERSER